ncbi:MAG: Eco57I restriction-modification methylase domain-containing protein [Candidatus Heimdallarchaeota archaeon]
MSEVNQAGKESLEFSWYETVLMCREIIEQDLRTIQDNLVRSFYSQVFLNRILLLSIVWYKFPPFLDSNIFWKEDFHRQVMIPFLEKLSGIKPDSKSTLKINAATVPGQKSLLHPQGGKWSISDIQVSDVAYSSVFTRLEAINDQWGENSLKELFGSQILGEAFEDSLTRSKKKAKGVFYTPTYVADSMASLAIEKYIIARLKENGIDPAVLQSVPPKYSSKTLKNVLMDLKILDNAVGGGEYLLSALKILIPFYKMLLNGQIKEKKRLQSHNVRADAIRIALTNNLYGVDVSPAAIDICKTRLWGTFLLEAKDGINVWPLPDLDSRIRIGNSLVGFPLSQFAYKSENQEAKRNESFTHEYYASHLKNIGLKIDRGGLDSLSAFHWPVEFPAIFENSAKKNPGFSIIIGNPPFQSTKRGFLSQSEKYTYTRLFQSANRQWDVYELFVERSLNLLQPNGQLCYLLPKPALTNENMEPLRKLLLTKSTILQIIDVGMPFLDAGVELIIVHINTSDNKKELKMKIGSLDKIKGLIIHHEVAQHVFRNFPSLRFAIDLTESEIEIIRVLKSKSVPLSKIISLLTRGIECGKKNPAINQKGQGSPLIRGEDVSRYCTAFSNQYIHFQENTPSIFKSKELYTGEKILLRRVASGLVAAEDKNGRFFLNTLYGIKPGANLPLPFLLALLNSKLLNWWFNRVFYFEEDLFPYVRKSQLLELPIRVSVPDSLKISKENTETDLFERYSRIISFLVETIRILISQNELTLARIMDEEVLDPLVFEFYFIDELRTNLLTILETTLPEIRNHEESRELTSKISRLAGDPSLWAPIRNEFSSIRNSEIFSASIGSNKFRKTWKKIQRNKW